MTYVYASLFSTNLSSNLTSKLKILQDSSSGTSCQYFKDRYYAFYKSKMKPSLSIIIITKNSAATIEKCLQSVAWADEVILLDSGSTDNTISLCQKYTDQVFQTDWPGFGIQKNRALEKATSEWIYSIDSDEWMSDDLHAEIIRTLQNPTTNVYKQPRRNQYCGQWIRFGDVGKDKVIRLFKRGTAKFSDNI